MQKPSQKGKYKTGGWEWLVGWPKVTLINLFMKRYGNLYDQITDIDNIRYAYQKARKGKGWQNTVKKFDKNLEDNLLKIQKSLIDKTFKTSTYKTKIIHEPKKRVIYKLPFSYDRIVQHALMNVVEPIWDKMFISDSYACRVGKGIHAGSKRTMELIRRNKYCLKCDISKFYPSINHDIAYEIICRKIKDKEVLWLFKDIVYSMPGGVNIPIGNYTSQWIGNLYLNEVDQRVKHIYKVKDYIRYCDDFILFSNDKKKLHEILLDLEKFLNEKLKLKLSKKSIFPVSQGVDFLGYRHFKKYVLLRKSTVKRVKKRLRTLPYQYRKEKINKEQYLSSLSSTNGWLKWANSYHLRKSLQIDSLIKELRDENEKVL